VGIGCDVRYFSLDYLREVGPETQECLAYAGYYSSLVAEWVFAGAAHSDNPDIDPSDADYLTQVLRPNCPENQFVSRVVAVLDARDGALGFIQRCVDQVDWAQYKVIGISTSFQQNMASLAFARLVKAAHPDILIVFGGSNCQGEMGVELHRRYPFIDAVCLGEGDRVFPELVQRHIQGQSITGLPGLVVRDCSGNTMLPQSEMPQSGDLDQLPYPDLDDFYEQRKSVPGAAYYPPAVAFETSRGCWWGAKHHCTFCGLNGRTMAYRSKSEERAYNELRYLTERYGNDIVNADAILDMRYFNSFLPRLASDGPNVSMYWQMKANMKPEQIEMLMLAGVRRIQPGIEALDNELLALMKKGCTVLQNIQVLKLAADHGLWVVWNLLYGFPGESAEAYQRSAHVMRAVRHLQPPSNIGRVFADRFSPYFQNPKSFGININPVSAYYFIYPFTGEQVFRLAYHFEMSSDQLNNAEVNARPIILEYDAWCGGHSASALYLREECDKIIVIDERWGWQSARHELSGPEAEICRLCWRITSMHEIERRLKGSYGAEELHAAVDRLLQLGILLQDGSDCLALPLKSRPRAPAASEIVRNIDLIREPAGSTAS
jgi:ribosomal peptide maturation radical SAM protein 1